MLVRHQPLISPNRTVRFGICLLAVLWALLPPAYADMAFHSVYERSDKEAQELGGINNIVQDPEGFMWFGGDTGLGRYDGRATRVYEPDPEDPHSLAHGFVRDLLIDHQGVLWVATDRGLCRYVARLDRFACGETFSEESIPPVSVRSLAVDAENNIYLGSEAGLYRLSADRQRLLQLNLPESGTSALPLVVDILVEDTTLWLATDTQGLIRLNLEDQTMHSYRADDSISTGLAYDRTHSLAMDAHNRLWVATYGGGVSVLSADRKTFEHHQFHLDDPYSLGSNVIWRVFRDSFDTLWLAVDQGGLVRFDEQQQRFIAYRHKPYDTTSLTTNQVRTIYEDRNGDLWVGLFPHGVSYYNRANQHIQNYKHEPDNPSSLSDSAVLTIHRDERGQIWVGTEDGLNLFDLERRHFTRFQFGMDTELTAKAVLSIEQFDDRTLWIGTWSGGLLAFDLDTHQFSPIDTTPIDSQEDNSRFIWGIHKDIENDKLWLATEFNGVVSYQRQTQQFHYYKYNPNDAQSLPGNFARAVSQDRLGTLWVGTYSGLAHLPQKGEGPVRRVQTEPGDPQGLRSQRIVGLHEDSQGRMWVASRDQGVFVYSPNTREYRQISTLQGLPSPVTSGTIEDQEGNIWLLTTNGLVKINPKDWSLQVFGTENGLAGNNFNRNASLLLDDGRLLVGGGDGLSLFDPKSLNIEVPEFQVYLTSFRVMNQPVHPSDINSLLKDSIVFTERIELPHNHMMFSFDFAALNYRNLLGTRYAYKLEGFDQAWHEIGRQFSATYTNIQSGDYRFRVRAAGGDGHWREAERAVHLHVGPAPWQTPWAYILYTALFVLAAALLANYMRLYLRSKLFQALSTTDTLTGLTNRLGLTHFAHKCFAENTPGSGICVVFIDVDHFKSINDQRGHDSGDRILIELAQVFRGCIRQSDLLGRWGGEEFLMICSGLYGTGGAIIAEKIRSQVAAQEYDQHHGPIAVTVSIGVATVGGHESFESAFKRADQALYKAKAQGRNRCVCAD